ncbi:MAG: hypothetical protein LCH62_04195 [Proteobacteria bacterium]|nr:hypothetical protein [Pseudomonadota bacterium]
METILRRIYTVFLAGLALAACHPAPPSAPALRAGLSQDGRVLEIQADDASPIVAAELRPADVEPIPARKIDVIRPLPLREERPGVGVGASGGSSSGVDFGMSFRVPLGQDRRPRLIRSTALIDLPENYRRGGGIVRITFADDNGDRRVVDLPAP